MLSRDELLLAKFDVFRDGTKLENGPVPAFDPADLRSVWVMQNDVQALGSGEQLAIGADSFERPCTPGAGYPCAFHPSIDAAKVI